MSNLTKTQNTTPVYMEQPGAMTSAQHVAIATFYAPTTSYAATQSNNADPLPKMILLVLLSGLAIALFSWLLGRPNAEQQKLMQQNAQLEATNRAMVGCVTGVMGGQQ